MSKLTNMVGSWDRFMADILQDKQVVESLNTLNYLYTYGDKKIYPEQKDVFRAFLECPYDILSVVIILQDPYHDGSATGIAPANAEGTKMSPSLRVVKDAVSRTIYNGQDFNFDQTLVSWANQGVLLINTALTVESGNPLSHQKLWDRFTRLFLTKLSETNSGIVYCLWGKHARLFETYINPTTNTILHTTHPAYSLYSGKPWECNHFVEINKYLKASNNFTITW
jgi:uracil-DNA glycosylase